MLGIVFLLFVEQRNEWEVNKKFEKIRYKIEIQALYFD